MILCGTEVFESCHVVNHPNRNLIQSLIAPCGPTKWKEPSEVPLMERHRSHRVTGATPADGLQTICTWSGPEDTGGCGDDRHETKL